MEQSLLLLKARISIALMAKQRGVSEEEIRKEICEIIEAGTASTDPKTIAAWEDIPKSGDNPTPEEFIAWIASLVEFYRASGSLSFFSN